MGRISRSLLLWLVALAVSFSGFADGAIAHCPGMTHGVQKSIAHSVESIDPEFPFWSTLSITDGADTVQSARACDSPAAIGSPQSPTCDLAGACSVNSALSSETPRVFAYSIRFAAASCLLLPVTSFLTDAPDRPPRKLA